MTIDIHKHQEIPKNYLKNTNKKGLLIFHGLGSGKTLTSISIAENYQDKDVIVITPASLQDNFKKELTKYNVLSLNRYTVTSFESFHKIIGMKTRTIELDYFNTFEEIEELSKVDMKNLLIKQIKTDVSKLKKKELLEKLRECFYKLKDNKLKDNKLLKNSKKQHFLLNKILIVDEVHRLHNNNGKIAKLILYEAQFADKIILLSGTPIVNHPSDISPLINLLSNDIRLPTTKQKFDDLFIKEIVTNEKVSLFSLFGFSFFERTIYKKDYELINPGLFKKKIDWLISYYSKQNKNDFPTVIEHHKPVIMSLLQEKLHYKTEKDTLTESDIKRMKGITEKINVSNRLNCYLNKTRQISNIVKGEIDIKSTSIYYNLQISPKLLNIVEKVKKAPKPILIYSNYLDFGIKPLEQLLKVNNLKYLTFTGETDIKRKKEIVIEYNEGKIDILLISSSGGEGLDLKNTRQIHIMEPHWNNSKIEQVIGRGVRYKSHMDLPKEQQKVDVYHWYSVFKKNRISADEYLIEISRKKSIINKKFIKLIEETSIEQNLGFVSR